MGKIPKRGVFTSRTMDASLEIRVKSLVQDTLV